MTDAGLDTMQSIVSACQVVLGTGVLQLRVPRMAVGVIIAHRREVAVVEVTL
jgi:hypothetical protein